MEGRTIRNLVKSSQPTIIEGNFDAAGLKLGIVVSRWNEFITKALLDGALDELRRHGADAAQITVVHVPGSFEIPIALKSLAQTKKYDALIADGLTVIKRFGTPEEVGRIAVTLATGMLPYTSGQAIAADGGLLTVRY